MWQIFGTSILLAVISTILLKVAGRKSISQMTTPQLAVILSLGTIIGSEVSGKGIAQTTVAIASFVGFLFSIEWISLRWNAAEKAIKGKPVVVIKDGIIVENNLRRLRTSVDDLKKRMRMAGITKIGDIKFGTIEVNGELGYELYPDAQPVSMGELKQFLKENFPHGSISKQGDNVFTEIDSNDVSKRLH